MKKCDVSGCKNNVFSRGKCKYHLYLIPSYQKKISRTSVKRKKEEKEYEKICRQIDAGSIETHGYIQCFFCCQPILEAVDHHHVAGREGTGNNGVSLYLDPEGIISCHPACHRAEQGGYHNLTLSQIREKLYFNKLMKKIKFVSVERYASWYIKLNLNPDEPVPDPLLGEY